MGESRTNTLIVFKVGHYHFCVPALEVEAIISPPAVTTIPFAPSHVVGTCIFRGNVAVIINLRRKLGLKRNNNLSAGQLLVSQLNSGLTAFWIDEVYDVSSSSALLRKTLPETNPESAFNRFLINGEKIILQTNLEFLYCLPNAVPFGDKSEPLEEDTKKPIDKIVAAPDLKTKISTSPVIEQNETATSEDGAMETGADQPPISQDEVFQDPQTTDSQKTPPQTTAFRLNEDFVFSDPEDIDAFDLSLRHKANQAHKAGVLPKTVGNQSSQTPGLERKRSGDPASRTPNLKSRFRQSVTREEKNLRAPLLGDGTKILAGILMLALIIFLTVAGIFFWPATHDKKSIADHWPVNATKQHILSGKPNGIAEKQETTTAKEKRPTDPLRASQSFTESLGKKPRNTSPQNLEDEVYRLETEQYALIVERPDEKTGGNKIKSGPPKNIPEHIHIVVKGDTLWDISSRYIGDPFKYLDLAQSNEIKNPDLIYPGDRVILIRKPSKR